MNESVDRERLVTGYSGRLFLATSLGWLFIQMGRQLLPPLLPNIIADLQITSTQAGFALTLMWGIYALCQYPSGRLSDRLSRKTLLVSGLGLLIGGFLVVWGTVSYSMFLIGVAVVGLGAGLYPTAARALVSDLFVRRRGQAFGVHTAAGDLGNASAAGLAVVAVAFATWNAAFLPMVGIFAGLLLVFHLWSREAYVFETVHLGVRSTGRRLFGNDRLRWSLLAYVLFAFTWQSTTGFLPTFLQFEKGFSVGLASTGFAVLFLVGMGVKPIAGVLGDRFKRTTVAASALLLGLVGLTGVLIVENTTLLFASIGVFAAGLMSFPPVMQAYLMDVFPDESMGGDLGGMRTVYIGIGSLGPTYVGFVAGIASYTAAFAGLVGCLLVSAGLIVAYEFRNRDQSSSIG
ncbi:MFS transporter [Halopenitus sp. H-Gu1]|uniref:MFS transporter n=1 Tax=Halopenitus sp. H-Gu1 TaxID=3242697 RepID=UPI00359D3FCB